MPITPWQAIVGKFLASWAVVGLALALTFPVVITVNYLGNPDNGVIFASYLGSFLMAGAYLAITRDDLGDDAQPSGQLHRLGGARALPDPRRLAAGDEHARRSGPSRGWSKASPRSA